jgi:hypothetical protein
VLPPGSTFAAGTLAGLTEAVVWVAPTERLKMIRQAELGASGGGASRGSGGSIIGITRHVVQREGIASLWLGTGPTAARQGIAMGLRFVLYERFKRLCSHLPGPTAAIAGGLSGAASTIITNPVDVIKTRMQSAPSGGRASRLAVLHLAQELLREEGLRGFARGLSARMLKIVLGQAVIFSTYEAVSSRMR